MDFRILSKGEKGVNKIMTADDVVRMDHQTVHPKLAPRATGMRIMLEWIFDFHNVTRLELLELAARSLVITFRAPFKTLDEPKVEDWDGKTFNVREWIDNEKRKPVDKKLVAASAFKAMSVAEQQEFLKSIGVEIEETDETEKTDETENE